MLLVLLLLLLLLCETALPISSPILGDGSGMPAAAMRLSPLATLPLLLLLPLPLLLPLLMLLSAVPRFEPSIRLARLTEPLPLLSLLPLLADYYV